MDRAIAKVRLQWLTPDQGGRKQPFVGSRYAATARFAGESELFSVVLQCANPVVANPSQAELRLLSPDLGEIQARITPGCTLEITEGPRLAAYCFVDAVAKDMHVLATGEEVST